MNKKAKIYLVLLVWLAAAVQIVVNKSMKQDNQIIEAFSVTESTPVESCIDAYGYFGEMYLSAESKRAMVINLANQLGITDGYEVNTASGDAYEKTELIKDGMYAKTTIQVISMETENAEGKAVTEQYFLVELEIYNDVDQVLTYRDKIEAIFADIGMEADINIYLSGSVSGELLDEEKEAYVTEFLETMNAAEVTGYRSDDMYTIYGYTKDEDKCVYQNGEKVNVNIAITYNEEEDTTYIHMAVPFINKTY